MQINIINWVEVWGPVIPLSVYFFRKPKGQYSTIITVYLFVALIINLAIDLILVDAAAGKKAFTYSSIFYRNNLPLYNLSSIIRVITFLIFFKLILKSFYKKRLNIILFLYSLFVILYFFTGGDFTAFDPFLHTAETITLLSLCILYIINLIRSEKIYRKFDPYLIIISGLAFYESLNFFVFLFYNFLVINDEAFAKILWVVPNAGFFIFCLFTARAFYGRINN